MYDVSPDPYCYPGTTVLKNRLGLHDQTELDKAEALLVTRRGRQALPRGRLSYAHYRAIHRHLFQDIYGWAGRIRRVRIIKGTSTFCYPEHIDAEMRKLFAWFESESRLSDLEPESFSERAAHFLSELNAIHPFREGNGRTQNVFLDLFAYRAGHPLDMERLRSRRLDLVGPMIAAFNGDERPLAELIRQLMRRPTAT